MMSTPKQDSTIMDGNTPCSSDVGDEYYLNYQNRRQDLLKVVNVVKGRVREEL